MNLETLLKILTRRGVPLGEAILFIADLAEGSLGDVARELGCSRSTVYRAIETGSPRLQKLISVAQSRTAEGTS